jgi:flagellin
MLGTKTRRFFIMRINHNIAALNTYRQLSANNVNSGKSLEKLSSGLRINRAGDDAAGLAISEKMRGQIRGLDQASRNAQDGISLIQTAEGALNETHSILQRMRELAVQSATDTNTADDRAKIQAEVDQLAKEITRISNTTEFNTKNLLAGGLKTTLHIGANQGQNVDMSITAMDAYTLGVAGSQVVAGAFAAGTSTGISSVSNLGAGLSAQTYAIKTTATAADTGTLSGSVPTGTLSGTFTGDSSLSVEIRIDTLSDDSDSATVTQFSYSIDGADWQTVSGSTGAIGSTGVTWTAAGSYNNTENAVVNEILSTTFTAASYSAQLKDGNGDNIGDAVTFKYSATSAVIGNAATGETLQINFASGAIGTSAADATQVVTTVGSTAASLGANGEVTDKAYVSAGINVSSQVSADKAITTINKALETVSNERSKLGAMQNRLEHTINNLGTSSENLTASEARIRDVDMAKEMMEFTKNNILTQAAQAMLAQANAQPQGVLQLLS